MPGQPKTKRRVVVHHTRVSGQRWETTSPVLPNLNLANRSFGAAQDAADIALVEMLRPTCLDPIVVDHVLAGTAGGDAVRINSAFMSKLLAASIIKTRLDIATDKTRDAVIGHLKDAGLSIRDMAAYFGMPKTLMAEELKKYRPVDTLPDFDSYVAFTPPVDTDDADTYDGEELFFTRRLDWCFDVENTVIHGVGIPILDDNDSAQTREDDEAILGEMLAQNDPASPQPRSSAAYVKFDTWVADAFARDLDPTIPAELRPAVDTKHWPRISMPAKQMLRRRKLGLLGREFSRVAEHIDTDEDLLTIDEREIFMVTFRAQFGIYA